MTDIRDFDNVTLGAWLDYWYKTYKQPTLKPYSLRNIEQVIRLHTPAWLKEKPLRAINVFDVDRALSAIPPSRTQAYVKQVWHNAFRKACALGILDRNVMTFTDNVKYRKRRGNALTIAEQTEFIERLDGKRCKWLMLFYLYTGVRRAEALDLEWRDVDEDEGVVLIRGTKTEDSCRQIVLTDDVRAILQGQCLQTIEERDLKLPYASTHPEKVFDFSLAAASHWFKRLCPDHTLHDLRHTYITRCAECGVDVVVCQQLVGHSTPDLTLRVYTHVMDEYKRREARKFTINPHTT